MNTTVVKTRLAIVNGEIVRTQFAHKRLAPRTIWKRYLLVNSPLRKPLINPADRDADYWRRE
jgi:hypothetical protein